MKSRLYLPILAVFLIAFGCAESGPPGEESQGTQDSGPKPQVLSVFATNYPLAYFAERIGGEQVEVSFPAPADVDPAYWAPEAEVIAEYQQADLILLNGAGYEKWIERASLPASKLIDTSATAASSYIPLDEGVVHTHGPAGEHSHKGWAFTTWLNPMRAIEQAQAIQEALSEARPEAAADFRVAYEGLQADLLALDAQLREVAADFGDRPVLFSHPVYQYLEEHLGLNGESVHWEPGEVPTEAMWKELSTLLQSHPAELMVWEGEPLEEVENRLAEMGLTSVIYDPCGNAPESGDFGSVMLQNHDNLKMAVESGSGDAN
ncbi:MAG: zinc ABC transporter solute-binding protein [Nitrospirae bacterium]|nr:zinc ABC transporter solute-binding protein [Nitrospirota bacterium]